MNKSNEILDQLATAVLAFNAEQICTYANEASQNLLQRSFQSLINKSCTEIIGSNKQVLKQCQLAFDQRRHIVLREAEIYLLQWQQSLLLDIVLTPLDSVDSNALLIELIDRKDVKKLADDANTAAKFKAVTQIVRGLSHEIKNPLGGIRGAAQLLALDSENAQVKEYTSVMMREADRLSELLDRMSSSGKAENNEQIDTHQIITQIAKILLAEYGDKLEIKFDFDTSLPRLIVNADQIHQAIFNLMKNAAQWALKNSKSAKESAKVKIITRTAYPDLMRSLMPDLGVGIQIIDNGPGVERDILDQLFMPMVSRREGGTGLGLSISQEIAQNHEGCIELNESPQGFGASFTLYLPIKEEIDES